MGDFKFADLKTLHDLSRILVLPMISVAFIAETGISYYDNDGIKQTPDMFMFPVLVAVGIFSVKVITASMLATFLYYVFIFLNGLNNKIPAYSIIIILLSFGLAGLFAQKNILQLQELNIVWYYSALVISFFLHGEIYDS